MKKSALLILLLVSSCHQYRVGHIHAYHRMHKLNFKMSYTLYHGVITIAGKSKSLGAFSGKVLKVENIQNLEKQKYPQIDDQKIERSIRTSYVKLRSDKRISIECYITQKSQRNFAKGGHGVCYADNGEIFDIVVMRL